MARYRTPHIGRPFDQVVTHNQMNDQFRAVENSQAISVTPPLTIENTLAGGTRLGINLPPILAQPTEAETETLIKQFKIVRTAHSDVIECIDFTGGVITSLDPIWVAKDWFMRGPDTWHGVTRNDVRYSYNISTTTQIRMATKAGRTEEQTIVPAYKGGDVIIVFRVDTGVIVPGTEGHDEPTKVKWIEPAGTRMWQVLP